MKDKKSITQLNKKKDTPIIKYTGQQKKSKARL
jgi:hypothetical protein